jgi:Arc/MetJ-type ribon-helix-helix transcriptional regulator
MKEITLRVPESKLAFIKELMKQLGFEISLEVEIPEEHKTIVRDRIKTGKTEEMLPWKEARKQFTFKDKS